MEQDAGRVEIARATRADRADVIAMWLDLFASYAEAGAPPELCGNPQRLPDTIAEWFALALADDQQRILLARSGDARHGFVACAIRDRPFLACPRIGGVAALWVAPGIRRQGVGRALAERALAWIEESGVEAVDLHPLDCYAIAQQFWAALGFRPSTVQMRRGRGRHG